MATLYCAIIGNTAEAFPISVESVDNLKKAIQTKDPITIQCDATDVQLFLAKKNDKWLTEADIKDIGSDTSSLKPLNSLDQLSEEMFQFRFTKSDIRAGKGPVHVLVVVPEQENLQPPVNIIFEVIFWRTFCQRIENYLNENSEFKDDLCEFYGCLGRNKSWMRCMLLDVALPESLVLESHLFPRRNEFLAFMMMKISDIDDVRNGLLLFKPLKHAFDHFQLSFIETNNVFRLKLFDSTIRDTRLIDLKDHHGDKVLSAEELGVLFNSVLLKEDRCSFDTQTTFGDVDGCMLAFNGVERPFYHCLNVHARLARANALRKHWIDESYNFSDFWTDFTVDAGIMKIISKC